MKAYFAHIRRDGLKEQPMGAHLLRVGKLMKEDAARIGLSSLAYLIGVCMILGNVRRILRTILIGVISIQRTIAARGQ